jgi:glycosyltransferase involved in cell wall biosynthesis
MAAVLVLGERWRQFVLGIAPAANVVVQPNSVRMPPRQTDRPAHESVDLLFLGVVGRRKGVYELLEAFATARAQCPVLRLTVAGNGEIAHAQRAAEDLGISDAVTFTGWLDGDSKTRLLERSDIYVLPSHNEGLPMSILEAMSWGLPIISTDVGAIAELVRHDTDGLIVPAGATEPLAQAIVRLASSRELRLCMGQSGRRRVGDAFSEDVVLPRLEDLYDVVQKAAA